MRLKSLRVRLDELGIDALLVTQGHNRRYLTGFTGTAGQLIVTREHALLLTDSRYWEAALRQAPDWELVRVKGRSQDALKEQLQRVGARRVGFEAQDMTVEALDRLLEALGGTVEWVKTSGVVERLRWVKEPGEVAALRSAVALTDETFTWMAGWLRPGMTESQVAWEIEKYMREHGASELSFPTIVASGPNAALPHAQPGERAIEPGEPVTFDMGAVVGGYHADLTRTIVIGEPDPRFLEVYAVVQVAQLAAEQGIRAGMTGKEADALAREVVVQAGFGDNFGHGLGHGVGLATHEGPSLSPRAEEDRLPAGCTVTVEPGIYLPGWGGVRTEDCVLVGADGVEVLSRASKEPRLEAILAQAR